MGNVFPTAKQSLRNVGVSDRRGQRNALIGDQSSRASLTGTTVATPAIHSFRADPAIITGVTLLARVGQELSQPCHHLRVGSMHVGRLAGILRQVEQLVVLRALLPGGGYLLVEFRIPPRAGGGLSRSISFQSPERIA
jgi:hypothetical protein